MTPHRFRDAMSLVFGSVRQGASRLGIHETAARRMARTETTPQPIPPLIAAWLEKAARFFEENPPPPPPSPPRDADRSRDREVEL